MLMRFDPFRELDRFEQSLASARRAPVMPMDAYRRGDQFGRHRHPRERPGQRHDPNRRAKSTTWPAISRTAESTVSTGLPSSPNTGSLTFTATP